MVAGVRAPSGGHGATPRRCNGEREQLGRARRSGGNGQLGGAGTCRRAGVPLLLEGLGQIEAVSGGGGLGDSPSGRWRRRAGRGVKKKVQAEAKTSPGRLAAEEC